MLLSDNEIIDLCKGESPLISPFSPELVRQVNDKKIISYGVSSYGYDLRAGDEYKIFTNINCKEIDPKNIDEDTFVTVRKKDGYILIPPNSFILTYSQEHLNIPRNVTGVVLGKSTYARAGIVCICTPLEAGWCFTGDTEVALANGTSVSFKDMVDRYSKGERFFGYTFGKDGTVEIAELLNPRKTRENAELVEVTLDNDEVIRCTPDHKFLTKENIYVEAKNLREGTSLMPLYRYVDKKGYESVASPIYGKTRPIYTHKLADNWNLKHGIYPFVPNHVRHHYDFNPANNYPTNIVRMTDAEHHLIHETKEGYFEERSKIGKHTWSKYLFQLKDVMNFKEIVSARFSKIARKFWDEDSESKKRWLESHKTPRPWRLKEFDKEQIWKLLLEHGTIRATAKILKTKADTIVRRFPDLIAAARNEGIIPNNHKVVSVKPLTIKEEVYCLTVPETHNFALDAGVFVHNCGHVTLEFANTTSLPVRFYPGEGCCQVLFLTGNECGVSYADRGGKYMNQGKEVVLPKV